MFHLKCIMYMCTFCTCMFCDVPSHVQAMPYYVRIARFMPRVEIVQKNNTNVRRLCIQGDNGKVCYRDLGVVQQRLYMHGVTTTLTTLLIVSTATSLVEPFWM